MTLSYIAVRRPRRPITVGLTAAGVVVVATALVIALALTGATSTKAHGQPPREARPYGARSSRLDAADWETVKNVIRLRTMALAPGRTAMYRSFAAYIGLTGLLRLHPVLPGRCAIAVSYLYDNMLDLHGAYPGEDWRPLRRLIVKQPPLNVCVPKAVPRTTYVS